MGLPVIPKKLKNFLGTKIFAPETVTSQVLHNGTKYPDEQLKNIIDKMKVELDGKALNADLTNKTSAIVNFYSLVSSYSFFRIEKKLGIVFIYGHLECTLGGIGTKQICTIANNDFKPSVPIDIFVVDNSTDLIFSGRIEIDGNVKFYPTNGITLTKSDFYITASYPSA